MKIKLDENTSIKIYWRYSLEGDSSYSDLLKVVERKLGNTTPMKKIKSILKEFLPKRTVTCYIEDSEGTLLSKGVSNCDNRDNFVKEIGRVKSLKKALKDTSYSGTILKYYFQRK